jgi:hypothetical protein
MFREMKFKLATPGSSLDLREGPERRDIKSTDFAIFGGPPARPAFLE